MTQLACAHCLYALIMPTSVVQVDDEAVERTTAPGKAMVRKVREGADAGLFLSINGNEHVGFYAETTYKGTAVCLGHLPHAAGDGRL